MKIRCLASIIAMSLLPITATAQSVDLTGEWRVTFDSHVQRRRNGEVRVLERAEGTLELQQTGDSLRGWWNGRREVTGGIVRGNGFEFWTDTLEFEATGDRGVRIVRAQLSWRGTYRDGRIEGTWYMRAESPIPPRRWEAERSGDG